MVFKIDMDKVNCYPREIQTYLDIANGIAVELSNGGYREGCRNNIMVDLVCVLGLLGLPWDEVIDDMDNQGWFDGDDENPICRAERISDYSDNFSWNWMIDPSVWIDVWHEANDKQREEVPVSFKL